MFPRASLIIKCFKIGGTESPTQKRKILFLERIRPISKLRQNLSLFNSEMRFSVMYLYCPGESLPESK